MARACDLTSFALSAFYDSSHSILLSVSVLFGCGMGTWGSRWFQAAHLTQIYVLDKLQLRISIPVSDAKPLPFDDLHLRKKRTYSNEHAIRMYPPAVMCTCTHICHVCAQTQRERERDPHTFVRIISRSARRPQPLNPKPRKPQARRDLSGKDAWSQIPSFFLAGFEGFGPCFGYL